MECDAVDRQAGLGDRIFCALLYPGTWAADLLGVRDPDSRLILRMFVNLSVYSKLAVVVALAML